MTAKKGLFNILIFLLTLLIFMPVTDSFSKDGDFLYLNIENTSRYKEDRIAFQHVEHYFKASVDNSAQYLMVIRDRKIYLLTDGYDDINYVYAQRNFMDMEKMVYDPDVIKNDQAFWTNQINGKVDRVVITDRKVEILKSFDEKFVDEKFGAFYKNIRDSFLKKHVYIFKQLMANRKDSEMYVERQAIPKEFYVTTPPGLPTKSYTKATAKTIDGRIYYCEDMDGDGVTETFSVTLTDGFNWGYKSGPNMIFIYDNKNEELKNIIGTLAHEAYFGTEEEKAEIEKTVKKEESKIMNLIEDLVKVEKFYK